MQVCKRWKLPPRDGLPRHMSTSQRASSGAAPALSRKEAPSLTSQGRELCWGGSSRLASFEPTPMPSNPQMRNGVGPPVAFEHSRARTSDGAEHVDRERLEPVCSV